MAAKARSVREIIVGTDPALCDLIVFDDPYVSPTHCALIEYGGRFHVRDLGSSNGTIVRSPVRASVSGISRVTVGWRDEVIKRQRILFRGEYVRVGRTVLPWAVDR